jgi:hypothetical protein
MQRARCSCDRNGDPVRTSPERAKHTAGYIEQGGALLPGEHHWVTSGEDHLSFSTPMPSAPSSGRRGHIVGKEFLKLAAESGLHVEPEWRFRIMRRVWV